MRRASHHGGMGECAGMTNGMTRGAWRMIVLASLGGTLEYYDFVLFGIFAR